MNKETINCQVVMLPTEKSNMCHLTGIDNIKEWNIAPNRNAFITNKSHGIILQPFDIYFTSDEEIKGGDWYYNTTDDKIDTTKWAHILTLINQHPKAEKIVASTDPSLGLPAIPESFLKQYVDVDGKIDMVRLEIVGEDILVEHRALGIMTKYLKLTVANKVVIVEQSESDKGYEKFLNNPEEYIEKTRNASEDKELEDAANLSAPGSLYGRFHFKAGATWQEQQEANNAIEFATWVIQNFWSFSEKDKSWYNRTEVAPGKEYKNKTSQQLYELWQKSKSNADN
jgi:hypothetical protein